MTKTFIPQSQNCKRNESEPEIQGQIVLVVLDVDPGQTDGPRDPHSHPEKNHVTLQQHYENEVNTKRRFATSHLTHNDGH